MNEPFCSREDCVNTECLRHYTRIDRSKGYALVSDYSVCCLEYRRATSGEKIKQSLAECNKEPMLRNCEKNCPYYTVDVSCLHNLRADALEYILQKERSDQK